MVQTLPADEQAWRNVQAAQPESGYCKIKKLSGIGNWLLVWPGDAAAKCGGSQACPLAAIPLLIGPPNQIPSLGRDSATHKLVPVTSGLL